jgi:hypothetical protein
MCQKFNFLGMCRKKIFPGTRPVRGTATFAEQGDDETNWDRDFA